MCSERGGTSLDRRGCVLRCGQIARSRWRCFGAPKEQRGPAKTDLCRSLCASILPVWLCAFSTPAVLRKQPNPPSGDMANMMVLV